MLEYDSPAVMNNRMSQSRMTRPHLMIVTLFGTRDFGRSICFNSRIVFSWIFFISLVMEATGLPSPFFYALGDIVIRFFDTDLSLLIFFCVIEVKQKEVVTVTSVRYSCKTLKLLKLTISFGWEKINVRLTVNKDFNGSMLDEEIINGLRTKIYDRDRDWQVCTVGITGLRMKFKSGSRD